MAGREVAGSSSASTLGGRPLLRRRSCQVGYLTTLKFRVWDPLSTVAALVGEWDPGEADSEKGAERSLCDFLRARLPGLRITPQYGHDRFAADIFVADKVAIELKRNLNSTAEYQRLVGQIENYAEWRVRLVVVLVGTTDPDLADRIEDHLNRRFNTFYDEAKLVTKRVEG